MEILFFFNFKKIKKKNTFHQVSIFVSNENSLVIFLMRSLTRLLSREGHERIVQRKRKKKKEKRKKEKEKKTWQRNEGRRVHFSGLAPLFDSPPRFLIETR